MRLVQSTIDILTQRAVGCGASHFCILLRCLSFSAPWDRSLDQHYQQLQTVARRFPALRVFCVDVDEAEEICSECGVVEVPTLQLWRGGRLLQAAAAVSAIEALIAAELEPALYPR